MIRGRVPTRGGSSTTATRTRSRERARRTPDAIDAAYEEGAIDPLRAHLDEGFVCHPGGGASLDAAATLERIEATRAAFPDFSKEVVSLVADGDEVAVRYQWSGTHEGEFVGVAATGTTVETTSLTLMRLDGDRLAELFIYGDSADPRAS